MKIKAGQITSILLGLGKIKNINVPAATSYWLARISSKLQLEAEIFEKQRIDTLKKYSETDDSGDLVLDKDGQANLTDKPSFNKEYADIADKDIEVAMDRLPISDFGAANIPSATMALLLPLIKDNNGEQDE